MNQQIVYLQNNGYVTIIIPTPEALESHDIESIAQKDVPYGKPYKIVNAADIPTDRTFRSAWTIDPTVLTDGVGAESNEFPEVRT